MVLMFFRSSERTISPHPCRTAVSPHLERGTHCRFLQNTPFLGIPRGGHHWALGCGSKVFPLQVWSWGWQGEEELDELLCTFPIHALSMRIDETIPLSQAWWMPAFEKAAQVFTTASLQDPRLCFWNDLPFPILPLPEEFLPFTELDPGFHQEDHSSPSTLLLLALTRWLLTSQILSSKKMSCHPLLGMWSRELIRPRTPADSTVPSSEFIAALGDTVFPSSAVKWQSLSRT